MAGTEVARPRITDLVSAEMSEERVELVRRTVAKGASDDELAMLFSLADRYGLDPFAKEIWCICQLEDNGERKMKNGQPVPAQIMASRDGFLAIANRDPQFDGMDSDYVCAKDTFQRNADGTVAHEYGRPGERDGVVGAYAVVYRKDRRVPVYFFARWSIYGQPNAVNRNGQVQHWSPWAKYPDAMILKVAEAMALKRAFSLSGLTAEEELAAGEAIDEGADSSIPARPRLRAPEVSPRSRGIGAAKTEPVAQPQPEQEATESTASETDGDGDGSERELPPELIGTADDPATDAERFGGEE